MLGEFASGWQLPATAVVGNHFTKLGDFADCWQLLATAPWRLSLTAHGRRRPSSRVYPLRFDSDSFRPTFFEIFSAVMDFAGILAIQRGKIVLSASSPC